MRTPRILQIFTDKEARENFWYYYKGHVAVVVFILILLTMTIIDMVNNSRPVFQVTYVNTPSALQADWTQCFTDNFPSDSEHELITDSLFVSDALGITELEATIGRIFAQIAAGEIDIFVTDQDTFQQFAAGELFEDLHAYLPEEMIEDNTAALYYSNVDGEQCITGLVLKHASNGVGYVLAIPFSSTLKEPAAMLIQSLLKTEGTQ